MSVLLGSAFLSEPLTASTLVAGAAIVVSVVLILRAPEAPRLATVERLEPAKEGATLAA